MTTTLSPVPSEDSTPFVILLYMGYTNGSNPTLDFGFGAKSVVNNFSGLPLKGSEMVGFAILTWDGSELHLINPDPAAMAKTGVQGVTELPDGSIISLPLSFPNSCDEVVVTDNALNGQSACYGYGTTTFTQSTFQLFCTAPLGDAFRANIVAIGH